MPLMAPLESYYLLIMGQEQFHILLKKDRANSIDVVHYLLYVYFISLHFGPLYFVYVVSLIPILFVSLCDACPYSTTHM